MGKQEAHYHVLAAYEALQTLRDKVLESLDEGECSASAASEEACLQAIDAALAHIYPEVLLAEPGLIAHARVILHSQPTLLDRYPECQLLVMHEIPKGMWEQAVKLAAWVAVNLAQAD